MSKIHLSHEQWLQEAERRYGPKLRNIRFRCPACGHVQSGQDFIDLGMSPAQAAQRAGFSCIGRWMPAAREAFGGSGPGPCNYAGAGLFRIAPIMVSTEQGTQFVFDFADEPLCPPAERSPGNTPSERMTA